jgi:dipeptidyl-peptidase-4
MLELGPRRLRAALLLPSDDDGSSRLPVLLDPYGGPHAQRVLASHAAFITPQWFADQGFAVLVVDGRGSPGRGPRWERGLRGDLASVPLQDQLDALVAAGEQQPRLDLDRVGIRGWSFGGYLAALAALRAPQRIRAAIAGAPVTDWRMYDTHYTERYLGTPASSPEAYTASSLIDADASLGPAQAWPDHGAPELLLIHGLADDNVVSAHTLRLSSALLADGRAHRFLPLSGVTHMTPQEVVAEQLLLLQVRFLREVLGGPRTA